MADLICRFVEDLEFTDYSVHTYLRMRIRHLLYLPPGRQTRTSPPPPFAFPSLTPPDKVAVGTKSGEMMLYDIIASTLLQTVKAHDDTIWSIHVRPDNMALVSGSADKDIKFWEFEYKDIVSPEEGVTSVCYFMLQTNL